MDSIDSIHGQIVDLAYRWVHNIDEEEKRNFRNKMNKVQESTTLPRLAARDALQEIRALVHIVEEREQPEQEEVETTDDRFCSTHNSWHVKGIHCE